MEEIAKKVEDNLPVPLDRDATPEECIDALSKIESIIAPSGGEVYVNGPDGPRPLTKEEEEQYKFNEKMAKAAKILQKKSVEERIKWGIEQREKGNEYFKQKNFNKAREYYIFSLACMGADIASSDDILNAFNSQVRIPSMNNAAACEIQLENYEAALVCCDGILETDPNNTKALLRKAKALIKWEKMKDGLETLDKLSSLIKEDDPITSQIQQLRDEANKLKLKENKYQKKSKKSAKKIVNGFTGLYDDQSEIGENIEISEYFYSEKDKYENYLNKLFKITVIFPMNVLYNVIYKCIDSKKKSVDNNNSNKEKQKKD